ncbi:HAD-superfamily hydrolase subfamily IA variant 3 [Macrophomina phaseolina MS6]|uniref:HAD-superfamily hydrolase subfamily IA variant 3 n=1 Tax=Macrophomina phaseolina (strain MS6) TaxID=1126212 RepID=K2RI21_MACPH|nr:HAD-superfamily hydrolase subfamily IA variant 3 [Macrophomina phaseolina MS6]
MVICKSTSCQTFRKQVRFCSLVANQLTSTQEHFEIVRRMDLPWPIITSAFASGHEGMRKPDLCFFNHVLGQINAHPSQVVMVDDEPDNICAARSLGIHGILHERTSGDIGKTLRNLFQDPVSRAEAYMKNGAGNHHCVMEGYDAPLMDNFAQLLIWELTGDADLVYIRFPSGKLHAPHTTNSSAGTTVEAPAVQSNVANGLWNYFYDKPVQTTRDFPPDADTTSTAYLCLPSHHLDSVADVNLVMKAMAANTNADGIMQTYFCADRPRTSPEVCCNILRVFCRFGCGDDPRIRATRDWVVRCLHNRAYVHGSRFYSTPETFLYFSARLYLECSSETLKEELEVVKEALLERVNVPVNPLALALRIFACQLVGIDARFWRQDLAAFQALQEEDGGWPAGHFCCMGRTGAKIGNRGLTTALALRIMERR